MTNRTFRNGSPYDVPDHCGPLCAALPSLAGVSPLALFTGSPDFAINLNNHSKL
jgi:hypothetical protein